MKYKIGDRVMAIESNAYLTYGEIKKVLNVATCGDIESIFVIPGGWCRSDHFKLLPRTRNLPTELL